MELNRHFSKDISNDLQAYEKMFNITNHQESANQNHDDIISHLLLKWVLLKEITKAGKDAEKYGIFVLCWCNVNWFSYYGKQFGEFSKNNKYNHLYHILQQSPIWYIYMKKMKSLSWKGIYTPLFNVLIVLIHNSQGLEMA